MHKLILASLLPLAACGNVTGDDDGTPGVPAQGTGTTRTYAVSGFTEVALRGSDDVDVRVGPGFTVRAEGDPKLLDQLKIEKVGDTLRIGRLPGTHFSWSGKDAKVFVTMPRLAATSVAGSGDMAVDRVAGDRFVGDSAGSGSLTVAAMDVGDVKLSLAGSGDMTLKGRAKSLGISVAGSGDVDAGGLTAAGANVSVAGSGNVKARVDGAATVSVMGSGDVDLGPSARCDTTKMGSGSVHCGG